MTTSALVVPVFYHRIWGSIIFRRISSRIPVCLAQNYPPGDTGIDLSRRRKLRVSESGTYDIAKQTNKH